MATYLAPIEKPRGLMLRMGYYYTRRQFGKVLAPLSVFCARLPSAFTNFYGKIGKLDKKLVLPNETRMLIRERVASLNCCGYCMDANRWAAIQKTPELRSKLDELHAYRTSELFDERQRAALDYVTELTETRQVSPTTFAQLSQCYDEREICEIVYVVASEHMFNINNIGLNIGSDGLCALQTTGS